MFISLAKAPSCIDLRTTVTAMSFQSFIHYNYHIMIRQGTQVEWEWGNGSAQGKVKSTYTEKISRTIDGQTITRHGESGNKALLIEQADGQEVLKLESEVSRV